MPRSQGSRSTAVAASLAVLFGVVTMLAGTRVLLGADPGYVVYPPLLVFNTLMGVAYVAVGVAAWRRPRLGVYGAGAVLALNTTALAAVAGLYTSGSSVAGTSMGAMTFRTVAWLVLFLVLMRATRHETRP